MTNMIETNIKIPTHLILKDDGTFEIAYSESEEQKIINKVLSRYGSCTSYNILNNYQLYKSCYYKVRNNE